MRRVYTARKPREEVFLPRLFCARFEEFEIFFAEALTRRALRDLGRGDDKLRKDPSPGRGSSGSVCFQSAAVREGLLQPAGASDRAVDCAQRGRFGKGTCAARSRAR